MRRALLPLVALLMAGMSTFAVRTWLEAQRKPATTMATKEPERHKAVLVAASELPVGAFIQPDSVRWQDWPDVATPESYLVQGASDIADLTGAVVRRVIGIGQPVTMGSVVKPGERGFLAAVLEPGMRAISVSVDEASSNAGLISPGDHVDLVLTQTIAASGDPSGSRRVGETVLQDLRIIAMGRRLNGADSGTDIGGPSAKTATLEATPAQAEKIALVTELGRISLSLRSLAADAHVAVSTEEGRFTWDSDASRALRSEDRARTTMSVVRAEKTEAVNVRRGAGS